MPRPGYNPWRELYPETRFLKLLSNLESDRVFRRETVVSWKCRNCGFVHEREAALERCPACAHPREHFELFVETY